MASELKEKIKMAIEERADDNKFLSVIYSVIESYDNENIPYFDNEGNPLTREQLTKRIADATNRVKNGKFLSTHQLREHLDKWANA